MGVLDSILGTKKPLIPPVPSEDILRGIPKDKEEQPSSVAATLTKPPQEDYKAKYEELKKKLEHNDSNKEEPVKPEQPEKPVEPKEQPNPLHQIEGDLKWFYEKYGQTFEAQQAPANNETIIINLLYGCLMELRELNKKASS